MIDPYSTETDETSFSPDSQWLRSMHESTDPEQLPLTPVLVRMLEGRVGSTRMMELLGSSPAVAFDRVYPFENSYLSYFVRLLQQPAGHGDASWNMAELIYGETDSAGPLPFQSVDLDMATFAIRALPALWQVFSQAIREANSIREGTESHAVLYAEKYWGSVTPVIEAGLSPIVIDLVRDPRDVLVSMRAYNKRRGEKLFGRPQETDDSSHLRHVIAAMGFRLRELSQPLPVPRQLVRYEDLMADIGGHTKVLSSLLKVDLDPDRTLCNRDEVALHMTSSSAAGSVGRWRTELSPSEIHYIEKRLGGQMVNLGYQLSTSE